MSKNISNIKLLIGKGKSDEAIEELQKILKEGNPKFFNQVTTLSAWFHKHMRDVRLGLNTDDSVLNRISLSLLEICDELVEKDALKTLNVSKSSTRSNIQKIKSGLAMKKKFIKDFLDSKAFEQLGHKKIFDEPYLKFNYNEVLIRSVDDTTYPNIVETDDKISPHLVMYPYDIYHNGLEIWITGGVGAKAIIDKNGFWESLYDRYDERQNNKDYEVLDIHIFGRIPFWNIVIYELEGDEYTNMPIIYCKFDYDGTPFEEYVYRTAGEYVKYVDLDKDKMTKFEN